MVQFTYLKSLQAIEAILSTATDFDMLGVLITSWFFDRASNLDSSCGGSERFTLKSGSVDDYYAFVSLS